MPEIPTPFEIPPEIPVCVCVPKPPTEICLTLPFGIQICSGRATLLKYEGFDGLLMSFLGNLQPYLAPLIPILIIISMIKALIDCVNSIVDAISQLSPGPVLECLERIAELFPQLLQFIPPFNYIELINNVILFLISLLEAVIDALGELLSLDIDFEISLLPDDDRLRCCLNENIRNQLEQLAAALRISGPIFAVLAQILAVLEIPGLKPFIKPLREAAEALAKIQAEGLDLGLVDSLRDLQGVLREISKVLEAIGSSPLATILQQANDCECD